jgi:protein-S-isoprenylcysteine O-methyltransferase Ste14
VPGIILNLLADVSLKKQNTTVKPFEESQSLVTESVFRISRHPMYLGMIWMLIGITLLLGTLTPVIVVPVFGLLVDRVFIKAEERMLEQKFGNAWLAYKQHVRRWI